MSLKSFRSTNAILYVPTRRPLNSKARSQRTQTIVFFITGNPGLISYYDEFLNILSRPYSRSESRDHVSSRSLSSSAEGNEEEGEEEVIVAGHSLGGFVDSSATNAFDDAAAATITTDKDPATASATAKTGPSPSSPEEECIFPPSHTRKELYSLRDQIDLSYERLVYLVGRVREYYDGGDECGDGTGDVRQRENGSENHESIERGNSFEKKTGSRSNTETKTKLKVILMGHSVGAYIALEIVRLHHQYQRQHAQNSSQLQGMPSFRISSAHLLTPTILNISHSPSGRIATPLLSNIPFFPSLVQLLSSSLAYLISPDRLEVLVSHITGMKKGSQALKSTVRFLGGRGMVQQALGMARDEMREIGADSWGEEVWGVSKEVAIAKGAGDGDGIGAGNQKGSGKITTEDNKEIEWVAPRLYFLFAKKDHWVADLTRQEIIEGFRAGRKDQQDDGTGTEGPGRAAREPTFVVDETNGLVHAWCLEQSSIVAERVRGWIMETLEEES